jgi:hypothetical protein
MFTHTQIDNFVKPINTYPVESFLANIPYLADILKY